jgi:hypothetical protein
MPQEKIRVSVDGVHTYEAWADLALRWNGWLSPHFPLDQVRALAEHTQADMEAGHQVCTVHVIDGYQYTEEDGAARRQPAATVLLIDWDYYGEFGPEEVTRVITPDSHGRYAIGGFEWTWYQVEEPQASTPGGVDPTPPKE